MAQFFTRGSFHSDNEAAAYNRVAWKLIPFLLILYIISFLDRVNVGFAKLQMAADIGLSDAVFGLGAGIFFIGYAACEIPSNILLQRFGARIWISRILVVWGIISICFMFVTTPAQFLTLRFLLGIAEAGFYPGIVLYLTYWFPGKLRSQVCALFFIGIPIAGLIGAPLSGFIMKQMAGTSGYAGWQWLFLLEGLPAVIGGIVTYLYLANGPKDATWLAAPERNIIVGALEAEEATHRAMGHGHRLIDALTSGKVWLLAIINFSLLGGIYGIYFWMPQIVKDLGVKDVFLNGVVTSVPFAVACIIMIAVGRSSDRMRERKWHIIGSAMVGALGLIGGASLTATPALALASLSLAFGGGMAALTVLWVLPSALLTGAANAGGLALMATVGNLGGYVAPYVVGLAKEATGRTDYGLYLMAAVMIVGGLLVQLLPRNSTIDEAEQQDVLKEGSAVGAL
ncbi:MAG TPA: MFS transporter [Bradyrhizobium sp.]|uniref:MFS transporter n=1 Tax=Bradyrhizobium sp. TaxID=376 RepID=UPI002D7F83F1|nr:MFS transporter [Bradyrhizobium sp.]HET7887340.1 MFS transporter [Bradyrhizobium sp.]